MYEFTTLSMLNQVNIKTGSGKVVINQSQIGCALILSQVNSGR